MIYCFVGASLLLRSYFAGIMGCVAAIHCPSCLCPSCHRLSRLEGVSVTLAIEKLKSSDDHSDPISVSDLFAIYVFPFAVVH